MDLYPIIRTVNVNNSIIDSAAVAIFLKVNHQLLKDLSDLSKLLLVCAKKLYTNPDYCEALCRLIELCGLPFLKEKASDENTYAPQVIEVLTILGELVCMDSEPVRAEVARAVAAFSTEQSNQALMEGILILCISYVKRTACTVVHSGIFST